jgi:hypothetical protein
LQANDEGGGGTGFAAALVENGKPRVRHFHDCFDDGAEAIESLTLHAHDAAGCPARQQLLGNKLFAADADDHDLAAEIRVQREVLQRSDR